jgi:hypothetical protein
VAGMMRKLFYIQRFFDGPRFNIYLMILWSYMYSMSTGDASLLSLRDIWISPVHAPRNILECEDTQFTIIVAVMAIDHMDRLTEGISNKELSAAPLMRMKT